MIEESESRVISLTYYLSEDAEEIPNYKPRYREAILKDMLKRSINLSDEIRYLLSKIDEEVK